ncbi:MAG TPA: PRTRC system protein C [Chitinophagaceae bacterium]|nr:PRTRC system protein C [Chitinophagaceae bacterium]
MSEVITPIREFKFKKNGEIVTLPDPNPEFTTEECLSFYGSQYPELTTATVDEPRVEGKKATYNVKTTVGTKG